MMKSNIGSKGRAMLADGILEPETARWAALDASFHDRPVYRPTRQMAEQVATLDAMCQSPGCTVPADRCDIDHERTWPHGQTAVRNLRLRHRRHHNHKTRGTWRSESTEGGRTRWVTVSGREYLTQRYVYEDPLARPVDLEEMRAAELVAPPF